MFLDSGTCFWILGSVLDSGTCFWILGSVLDSGKCFWILGRVIGFWDVFWILGRVFGFWEVFLDSGTCFVPTSHGKKELLLWLSRSLNRLTCATRQIKGDSKLKD